MDFPAGLAVSLALEPHLISIGISLLNRSKTPRLTALGLACCASLLAAPAAHAAWNGQLLVGSQVPDWAVGDQYNCSGTLVTPRLVITTAECNYDNGFFHRKTSQMYYGKKISYPVKKGALGNVALFLSTRDFGGPMPVTTADVASYSEQERLMKPVTGYAALMEFYALDGVGADPRGKAQRQMRLVNAYMDMSQYTGSVANGNVIPDSYALRHHSAISWDGFYRNYLNPFIEPIRAVLGPDSTLQDIDDAIVLTIEDPYRGKRMLTPLSYDDGAGLFLRDPLADPHHRKPLLVGASYGTHAHVRLSHYWPWVVETLVKQGLHKDAILLSQKVLGTGTWGTNDRKAAIGQIFVYNNPYSNRLEYFRLISPDANGRYGYFPINQKDDTHWEYLGTTLPNLVQATTPFKTWGARTNGVVEAVAGTVYAYNNPYTREVEYFRLKASRAYGYFPVNKTSNADWTYLGTNLPTRTLKYLTL